MSGLPHAINEYLRQARRQKKVVDLDDEMPMPGIAKEYARFPRLHLAAPDNDLTLMEAAERRHSCRESTNNPPAFSQLGTLFGIAMKQHVGGRRRPYPSGGSLYPIEAYLIGRIEDEKWYAYHYQAKDHSLEKMWPIVETDYSALVKSTNQPAAGAFIALTSRWFRSEQKYRDFSYNLSLLEAGHVAQNILLSSVAANLCACPIGGFDEAIVSRLLDLFPNQEDPIYLISLSN